MAKWIERGIYEGFRETDGWGNVVSWLSCTKHWMRRIKVQTPRTGWASNLTGVLS